MSHYLDFLSISLIGLAAAAFLIKSYRSKSGACGSGCGGCAKACPTTVKQFKIKIVAIK